MKTKLVFHEKTLFGTQAARDDFAASLGPGRTQTVVNLSNTAGELHERFLCACVTGWQHCGLRSGEAISGIIFPQKYALCVFS